MPLHGVLHRLRCNGFGSDCVKFLLASGNLQMIPQEGGRAIGRGNDRCIKQLLLPTSSIPQQSLHTKSMCSSSQHVASSTSRRG
jgi:hypothetical protein